MSLLGAPLQPAGVGWVPKPAKPDPPSGAQRPPAILSEAGSPVLSPPLLRYFQSIINEKSLV